MSLANGPVVSGRVYENGWSNQVGRSDIPWLELDRRAVAAIEADNCSDSRIAVIDESYRLRAILNREGG